MKMIIKNKSQLKYAASLSMVLVMFCASPAGAAQTVSLKGKIREKNGKVIEGVLVRAISADDKTRQHETTSNQKGEFEFKGLPNGDYSLAFEKEGFRKFSTRNLTIEPGETLKLSRTIELEREGNPYAQIRGAVLYGVGYSLPNATVLIERIDGEKKFKVEKISQEGGEFGFQVPAMKAKYRITATARGFQPNSVEIEIENDEVRNVSITLQRQ